MGFLSAKFEFREPVIDHGLAIAWRLPVLARGAIWSILSRIAVSHEPLLSRTLSSSSCVLVPEEAVLIRLNHSLSQMCPTSVQSNPEALIFDSSCTIEADD